MYTVTLFVCSITVIFIGYFSLLFSLVRLGKLSKEDKIDFVYPSELSNSKKIIFLNYHTMSSSKLQNIREFINSPEHQERVPHIKRAILLSEKIFGRRKDLGITQTELAKRADTTQRIISEIEEGIYTPKSGIGDQLYDKLSEALEIDRDYITSKGKDALINNSKF